MDVSKSLIVLCGISPFLLGWTALSIVVGIRTGSTAGIRLFLLGFALLGAILAIGVIVFFLPNWAAVPLVLIGGVLPWIMVMRYIINIRLGGKLLVALPSKRSDWLTTIMSGTVFVFLGLSFFVANNDFLAPPKSYALGISLISFGIFRAIRKALYSQVREKGILYEFGDLYKWENIEDYAWKFGEDKLVLRLKKNVLRRNLNINLPSQFRQEVVDHLSQKIDVSKTNAESDLPS